MRVVLLCLVKEFMMDIKVKKISKSLVIAIAFFLIPAGLNTLYDLGYMLGSWIANM